MTTAIDTNVFAWLWSTNPQFSHPANKALDAAMETGALVISPPVFAELMAAPGVTEEFLMEFCTDAGIVMDWQIAEDIWREAGERTELMPGADGAPATATLAASSPIS